MMISGNGKPPKPQDTIRKSVTLKSESDKVYSIYTVSDTVTR